ncbi:MAG: zinc ribbon domain-containing protein [Candidatus Omnitrophota bacterium]
MPTYEYVCDKCGHEFELFQSMKDEPIKKCPECKANKVRRMIGNGAGIIFKGSGFYETDYKRKSASGTSHKETKKESIPAAASAADSGAGKKTEKKAKEAAA